MNHLLVVLLGGLRHLCSGGPGCISAGRPNKTEWTNIFAGCVQYFPVPAFPEPTNQKQLLRFLGMLNYYRKTLPNLKLRTLLNLFKPNHQVNLKLKVLLSHVLKVKKLMVETTLL